MLELRKKTIEIGPVLLAAALLLTVIGTPFAAYAGKNKRAAAADTTPQKSHTIDYSNIVWPNPPAIARIRYINWYSAQPLKDVDKPKTAKQGWMDRLAGTVPQQDGGGKVLFQLAQPYGMAVDSKGKVYVADSKVGAIFIFNTETRDVEMIKNKSDAHFVRIIGLAMDDNDRLFVSDPGLRHVLIFDANHKATDVITDGLVEPSGLAIDTQNRLLYISDINQDQILVYDADSLKLKRKIGTGGKNHELTTPGDFAKPSGVAVDKEGNLYVADTLNNRIEIFDADGQFIRTWGKNGDGPGYFARPKGVAIDSDGHVWVADGVQDRVQVFTPEGQLLISMGGHGMLPGQYQGLVSITSDNRRNRIYTSEIYPGRVQEFRYVTDSEYDQLKKERESLRAGSAPKKDAEAATATPPKAAEQTSAPQPK
jgi:DNA-binding beta-propeller fold protein YncE